MNSTVPSPPKPVLIYNNFTIYGSDDEATPNMMEHTRPQDWGDPERYAYRAYYYEATIAGQLYGHHCHCWTDVELAEWEYPIFFASCVAQLLMPGTGHELAGRRYLDEEDYWNDEWGPRPPYVGELDEN